MWKLLLIIGVLTSLVLAELEHSKAHTTHSPNHTKKHHIRMKYKYGNWRPHFGYRPSHYGTDHGSRRRRSAIEIEERSQKINLNKYVVRILQKDRIVCNGIIVNRQQVLTASICVLDVRLDLLTLKLYDDTIYTVKNSSASTRYTGKEADGLLTLLELATELESRFHSNPPICAEGPKLSDKVWLYSWDKNGRRLKVMVARPSTPSFCMRQIKDPHGMVVNNATICLKNSDFTVGCMPNFGLPYKWNGKFCGINILGHNCPSPSNSHMYVRVCVWVRGRIIIMAAHSHT
ncbi:uncharacterized protein Dana_GF27203 [Drosophila ananassae]|uniref:Peptidase S1 domain-containing protein n=1 Tax=Drosophila ananassae TaxID=7217 RepID=A0A0P8YGA5_DROAN|nr:uncharacterized protein Dana_GF27203 [Drosophila ananassae]